MRHPIQKILVIAALMGCGEKSERAKLDQIMENPANAPIRSECLGLDLGTKQSTPVDWDDHSPLRVCLLQQNDGAMAFDVRMRVQTPEPRRQALSIELKSPAGRQTSGVFPLVWNPFNGLYELQLSQGCLIGGLSGCSVLAPVSMRQLFAALPQAEETWRPGLQMTVSLLKADGKPQTDGARFVFLWNAADAGTRH